MANKKHTFIPVIQERNVRGLWRAVIMQAVLDVTSRSKNRRAVGRKNRAKDWLSKKDEHFMQTCCFAGMEPDYVQTQVNKYFKSR